MTATWTVGRRFTTLVPGMSPSAPKRNVIVALAYLYALGVLFAALSLAG